MPTSSLFSLFGAMLLSDARSFSSLRDPAHCGAVVMVASSFRNEWSTHVSRFSGDDSSHAFLISSCSLDIFFWARIALGFSGDWLCGRKIVWTCLDLSYSLVQITGPSLLRELAHAHNLYFLFLLAIF